MARRKQVVVPAGYLWTGSQLNGETGNYDPIFKKILTPEEQEKESARLRSIRNYGTAPKCSAKKAKGKVKRVETGVKADRHAEILAVLDALGKAKYKRGDWFATAKKVLGKEIPFNKKVREVYSKKLANGSYKRAELG